MYYCSICHEQIVKGTPSTLCSGGWCHLDCWEKKQEEDESKENNLKERFPNIDLNILDELDRYRSINKLSSEWCIVIRTPEFEYSTLGFEYKDDMVSAFVAIYMDDTPWIPILICYNGDPVDYDVKHKITLSCNNWSQSQTFPIEV